jgi:hypothetical protein
VRFEWDQVEGAREYVLTGRWTSPPSWAIEKREFRVKAANATTWDAHRVAFEVALPEGSYSWALVTMFGPKGNGDFANPTLLSFDVR